MVALYITLFLAFSAVSVSYGWGMRGTIIGGEKGAMLPGAFLGISVALFSGSDILSSNPYILAGVGALAMYCGGNMTYADTLDLSMKTSPAPDMKKGIVAIIIKGGIWYGLFGGYVSMFISVLSGFYSAVSLIVFFACLPVFAFVFFKIFNTPFGPEKNIFPKIYFSIFRRETWGGLLGMLLEIIIFTAVMRDWSSLAMTLGTIITGGISWTLSQLFQIKAKHPGKHGKRVFDLAYRNGLIDTWKIMECTFGALGGLGTALTYIAARPLFKEKLALIDRNGLSGMISDGNLSKVLICVYGALLLADTVYCFIKPSESERYKKYMSLHEKSEFALYSVIPMIMCFFGLFDITSLTAVCIIQLVLFQELAEKGVNGKKIPRTFDAVLIILVFALFFTQSLTKSFIGLETTVCLYTFLYEIIYFVIRFRERGKTAISNSEKTVHGYFIICCLLINIFTAAIL